MSASYPIKGDAFTAPQMKPTVPVAASTADMSGERNKKVHMEMLMEKLHSKAGQYKSFGESTKALKMALLDKRYPMDGIERQQLQKCLDSLQHSFKVTSLQAMVERLESVTRQLGLKFMAGLSGTDWFISSDMFYLEVILEQNGGVKDVKIRHEGKVEQQQQSCEELVSCLSRGDFSDFTKQLEGLAAIYQLNADKQLKTKAFLALQSLESDLTTLAGVQSFIKEPHNLVHKSHVGVLEKRKGGHPMRLTYFVSPYDLLDEKTRSSVPLTVEAVINRNLGQSVEVCIEGSNSSHKLATVPLISIPSSSSKSNPLYANMTQQNSCVLPASFILKLRTPMPMCVTLAKLIQKVTEVECGDLSNPQPLLSLITQQASAGALDCANNKGLFVTLPDQQHCYFLTEGRGLGAILIQSIPFTHPGHVPKVLVLLRQQALFNTLVGSCVRVSGRQEFENLINFEVSALSWQQLSVSFEHPLEESMATVELELSDISGVRCRLYSTANDTLNMGDFASKVVQRCLSIPITMRALIHKWQGQSLKSQNTNGNFHLSLSNFSDQNPSKLDFDSKSSSKVNDQSNGSVSGHGQLGSVMSQLSHGYASLSSPEISPRDSFFPSSQLTVEPINQKAPILNLMNEKSKKRKRKAADNSGIWAGRSPKRKMSSEDLGDVSEDTQGSTESASLGTPTQAMDSSDIADERCPVSPPDTTMEPFDFEEESATSDSNDELRSSKKYSSKKSRSKEPKNFTDNHQASALLLDLAENKSLVAPSVSITPISAAPTSPALSTMLTGMGLERRPGIEIIPIGSNASPSLPSSITITPIKSEERTKERSREEKSKSRDSKKLDEKRLEKKRKRRREESPLSEGKSSMRLEVMGPPQAPAKGTEKASSVKQDSSSKTASMKTSSPSTSPPLSSMRKFTSSPTHMSSSKPISLVKTSTSPTPKPPKTSQSPKHSTSAGSSPIYGSPKHSSPKHSSLSPKQSSSGKPSMSALKSASSGSLSSKSSSSGDAKKKDKKSSSSSSSSGHNSPKSKSSSSSVKLKQPDFPLSGGDAAVAAAVMTSTQLQQQQTTAASSLKGTSGLSPQTSVATMAHGVATSPNTSAQDQNNTSPCSSTAPTTKCQVRNRKGSLSAVIDKLKSAQHYTNEPIITNQKDQTTTSSSKSSSSSSSSNSSSQKTADGKTGNKTSSEYQVKSSSDGIKITINKTQRNKESKLSSLVSKISSLPTSPKTSSHTGLKPGVISGPASKKPQQKSSSTSSKVSSPSSSKSSSSKNMSPRPKSSSSSPKSSGATDLRKEKPRPKFEKSIFSKDRKLSPHREESDGERAFKLLAAHAKLDSVLPLDTPKLDPKFQIPKLSRNSESKDSEKRDKYLDTKLDNPKVELKRIDEKERLTDKSSHKIIIQSPLVSIPKLSTSKLEAAKSSDCIETEVEKKPEKSNKPKESDMVLDLATKSLEPVTLPPPPTSPKSLISKHPEWFKEDDVKKPGASGDLPMLLNKTVDNDVLLDFSTKSERKNTPPPLPVHLPPVLSPSVSVHIVKSPAPSPLCSPLVLPSPHSSQHSPCITDDELMDEALIGLGK